MRKFKAYASRRDDETGIGVEEYNEATTLSIASIYLAYKPSHKELFDVIAKHITDQLAPEETAVLRVVNPIRAKFQWKVRYKALYAREEGHIHAPFIQARTLAEDALERKETIIEGLPEGAHYKADIKGADRIVFQTENRGNGASSGKR